MTGNRENRLWRLNISVQEPQSSAHVATTEVPSKDNSSVPLSKLEHLLKRWHNRFGHANIHTLKQMARDNIVHGLILPKSTKLPFCVGCVHGKQHRVPFPINEERIRAKHPGEFFHSDISGPFQVPSIGGHNYFVSFKDDHSGSEFFSL